MDQVAHGGSEGTVPVHYGLFGKKPSFSPDGKKMVFRQIKNNNSHLMIFHFETNFLEEIEVLIGTAATHEQPAFSHDGRSIFYFERYVGYSMLFRINLDKYSLGKKKYSVRFSSRTDPLFSPFENKMALIDLDQTDYLSGHTTLLTMTLEKGNTYTVFYGIEYIPGNYTLNSWSADGKYLFYTHKSYSDGKFEIKRLDLNTTKVTSVKYLPPP